MLTPRCAAEPALRAECGRYGALNSFKPVTTENLIDDSSRYSGQYVRRRAPIGCARGVCTCLYSGCDCDRLPR